MPQLLSAILRWHVDPTILHAIVGWLVDCAEATPAGRPGADVVSGRFASASSLGLSTTLPQMVPAGHTGDVVSRKNSPAHFRLAGPAWCSVSAGRAPVTWSGGGL